MENYAALRNFESDFDKAQAEVRRAAALWVFGSFSALAYLFSTEFGPKDDVSLVASLIALSAISIYGFFSLWWVDQNTYQRLLHTIFVYGLYCEWVDRDDLGALKPRSVLYARNLNVTWRLSFFYLIPMLVFSVVSIGCVYYYAAYLGGSEGEASNGLPRIIFNFWILVVIYGSKITCMVFVLKGCFMSHDMVKEFDSFYPKDFHEFAADRRNFYLLASGRYSEAGRNSNSS